MKNIILLLIIVIANTYQSDAQVNLVMNPSFEEMVTCPNSLSQIMFAIGWDTLRNGGGSTSDFYNECCSFSACRVPDNLKGFQIPYNGKSYAGVISATQFSSGIQVREYIQGTLLNRLNNGNSYCVKFYVSLSNRSKFSCFSFGAYLDNGQIASAPGTAPIPYISPQIINMQGQLDDTLYWVPIEGSFIANGTEEYITIGNFFPDSLSGIQPYQTGTGSFLFDGSYYYIDDVSVIDISTPAFAGNDTVIIKGDSVYLGRPSEIGLDEACIWFLDGVPLDTVAGIMVAPDSTITYVLQQTICGNVQYDTVTVTVDTSTATALAGFPKQEIKVFPNPTSGELFFSSGSATEILVYSIDGRLLHREENPGSSGKQKIDYLFEKGLYIVLIKTEDGVFREKVVVY